MRKHLVGDLHRVNVLMVISAEEFQRLNNLVLSRILLFNAKRAGELGRMTVQDYKNSEVVDNQSVAELVLSDLEKRLCHR